MQTLTERERHAAPGGRPQPLAFLGKTLWAGCWDTDTVYAIDPQTWSVTAQVAAPGKPYGLAAVGNELRVVVAIGDDEDRFLYRFTPGQGFDPDSKLPCPDFTGSHLAYDGNQLYLAQLGNRRIVTLDERGSIAREIAVPTRFGGMAFGPSAFYIIAADEDFDHLQFATLDIHADRPDAVPVADIAPDARALAFDGKNWWTSYRELNEIVSFTI
jgi:YVTN family beta-propeller protein